MSKWDRFARWWGNTIQKPLGRWLPVPWLGVGFSIGDKWGDEVELQLDVEGRTGSVGLSKEMWLTIGAKGGWTAEEVKVTIGPTQARELAGALLDLAQDVEENSDG